MKVSDNFRELYVSNELEGAIGNGANVEVAILGLEGIVEGEKVGVRVEADNGRFGFEMGADFMLDGIGTFRGNHWNIEIIINR